MPIPRHEIPNNLITKSTSALKKAQIAIQAPVGTKQVNTKNGFYSIISATKSFIVKYEVIYAGNFTGYGKNDKADRCVRVLQGNLVVMDENKKSNLLIPGYNYS